jgi:hypothetical protein
MSPMKTCRVRTSCTDRASATSDVVLTALVPSQGFTTLTIDSASSEHRYSARFTDDGAFVVFAKWSDLDGDGGYLDVRAGLDSLPKAARLPGEGRLWGVEPVPGQSALLYVRQQEDGGQSQSR